MDLNQYISQYPRHVRRSVRERIGTHAGVKEVAVRHYANGNRQVPAERVRAISDATGGAVRPCELRADIFAPDGEPAAAQSERRDSDRRRSERRKKAESGPALSQRAG